MHRKQKENNLPPPPWTERKVRFQISRTSHSTKSNNRRRLNEGNVQSITTKMSTPFRIAMHMIKPICHTKNLLNPPCGCVRNGFICYSYHLNICNYIYNVRCFVHTYKILLGVEVEFEKNPSLRLGLLF